MSHFYEGSWREDLYHGPGILKLNGCMYDGLFEDGVKSGHGVEKFSDGFIYEGGYKDDLFHGFAAHFFPSFEKLRFSQNSGKGVLPAYFSLSYIVFLSRIWSL